MVRWSDMAWHWRAVSRARKNHRRPEESSTVDHRRGGVAGRRRDVYNLLNDNAVLTELQTLGSNASVAPFLENAAGGRPTGIMYPRIMRLAASVRF